MPNGSIQTILTCDPAGTVPNGACPPGTKLLAMSAYVVDPASQSFFDGLNTPYDYDRGSALWGWGFVFIMSLALISRGIGYVIQTLKSREIWGSKIP